MDSSSSAWYYSQDSSCASSVWKFSPSSWSSLPCDFIAHIRRYLYGPYCMSFLKIITIICFVSILLTAVPLLCEIFITSIGISLSSCLQSTSSVCKNNHHHYRKCCLSSPSFIMFIYSDVHTCFRKNHISLAHQQVGLCEPSRMSLFPYRNNCILIIDLFIAGALKIIIIIIIIIIPGVDFHYSL